MTHLKSISEIISQANESKLPYLIVGGHAVNLYGITRFTRDFDLLIPDTHKEPWIKFLSSSGYRLYHSTHTYAQFDNPSQDFPSLDIMLVDSSTWEKMIIKAETKPLSFGVKALVPHPIHLIAMKLFALSSSYRRTDNVDWSDVINLIREQKLSLDNPELRSIILKYGSEDVLQKLKNALS